MSESTQRESTQAAWATDRDGRVEALLVEGLDHYFRGEFDDAIHLWTRVLFIDRNHARARAYIHRARTSQAERLRRAEEMLHAAGELLTRGDLDQVRRLLAGAEQMSGSDEKVAELWTRLDRVARTRHVAPAAPAVVDARPVRDWRRVIRRGIQVAAGAAFVALLVSAAVSPVVGDWFGGVGGAAEADPLSPSRSYEVLSAEDVAVIRARQLYARGRLAEALIVLERIDSSSAGRGAADQLKVEIQQWLLTSRHRPSAPTEGQP